MNLNNMKPSELIRLAVSDLEKCEASPYTIDMGDWHRGFTTGMVHTSARYVLPVRSWPRVWVFRLPLDMVRGKLTRL